ncbi:MAG: type I methionyl aminopeptidase [Bacteroidetes bacterium]|nr:type I methionyl aminopeptidase [Bacteroidota bacterium]
MQVIYKTSEQIALIRVSSLLVGDTLAEVGAAIKPGIKTIELDKIAETFIRDNKAVPAFKGYHGFPASSVFSVNSEVVHGIPGKRELKEGDVVSIDCGVIKDNFFGDSAYTFTIGEVSEKVRKLIQVTKESLYLGIDKAVAGFRIGDISAAVQDHAESNGFGVVRELVGHGVGRNFMKNRKFLITEKRGVMVLKTGMVIAIEPMINAGKRGVIQLDDGWTIVTADRLPSAHFEHTVAIGITKADVLSSFEKIELSENQNINLSKQEPVT